jgi:hypothetical protein
MIEAFPLYIEFDSGIDHAAIERELDQQLGLQPKPKRERAWECLAGEAPMPCRHPHVSRSTSSGLTDVVCLDCEHEWLEASGE